MTSVPLPPGFLPHDSIPANPPTQTSDARIAGPLPPESRQGAEAHATQVCNQMSLEEQRRAVIKQRIENIGALIFASMAANIPHTDQEALLAAGEAAIRKAAVYITRCGVQIAAAPDVPPAPVPQKVEPASPAYACTQAVVGL